MTEPTPTQIEMEQAPAVALLNAKYDAALAELTAWVETTYLDPVERAAVLDVMTRVLGRTVPHVRFQAVGVTA